MAIPNSTIATRDDLLAFRKDGDYYISEDEYVSAHDDPQEVRRRALALLTIAVEMQEKEDAKAKEKAEQWELEHAVPLARIMYNKFHKYSDNYRDDTTEEVWLSSYNNHIPICRKWVAVAIATLKHLDADATNDGD